MMELLFYSTKLVHDLDIIVLQISRISIITGYTVCIKGLMTLVKISTINKTTKLHTNKVVTWAND